MLTTLKNPKGQIKASLVFYLPCSTITSPALSYTSSYNWLSSFRWPNRVSLHHPVYLLLPLPPPLVVGGPLVSQSQTHPLPLNGRPRLFPLPAFPRHPEISPPLARRLLRRASKAPPPRLPLLRLQVSPL